MFFKDIVGQQDVISELLSEVKSGKIAHGQLFAGKEGYGTLPLAMAFSRYLLCEQPGTTDACGQCSSCLQINELQHPDLHFVYPVIQSLSKTAEGMYPQWRALVQESPYFTLFDWVKTIDDKERQPIIGGEESKEIVRKISLKSFQGGYKVMIIYAAEEMNPTAANKILKILEEPPPATVFILLSGNPQGILPTIRSRTQSKQINRLPAFEISKFLQRSRQITAEVADGLASFCDGDLCAALELFKEGQSTAQYRELFIKLMRSSFKKDVTQMMDWADEAASLTKERQKIFTLYALHMLRQSLLLNYLGPDHVRLTSEEFSFIEKFSPYITGNNIKMFIDELDHGHYHLERNANAKILFTQMSFQSMRFIHRA
jgi:DNA polymerase-3 subunit delta'